MEERSIPLLGTETIQFLQQMHIAVFGLGGVGGYAVEALARQGVGKFSLFDFDVIQRSNINRQIIALESTLGKRKVDAMKARILDINPKAQVEIYPVLVNEECLNRLDFTNVDYMVDCIDDIQGKLAIISTAKEYGIPVIVSCGTANKLDATKFQIKDISKTTVCPLAKKLRLELKKRQITNVDTLFSTEEPITKGEEALPSVSFVPSVAGLLMARHIILNIQKRIKENRCHLVLEGGGMKGVYSAGVIDFLLEQNISFDAVYGVSAGACTAASFLSKQHGRAYHAMVDYMDHPECASKRSLTKTGNYFNKEFIYYKIPQELIPFDYETANQNSSKLFAVVTNLETGKAEYHPIMDYRKEMDYICASASLPMLAQIQEIDGKKYMDGGIADSIPFLEAKKNAIKCVVVLTKPKGYLCEKQNPLLFKALQLKYRKYPNFLKVLEHRHISYNRTVKLLERDPNVFIIRPSQPLAIDRLEKDKTKLEKLYQLGYNDALAVRDSLLKFINKNGI